MDRLTSKRCNGIKTGYWSPAKKEDLCQRLGPFEDIGLEPGEILTRLRLTAGCSHWIPVTERLPEPYELVFICRPTQLDKSQLTVDPGTYTGNGIWTSCGTRMRDVLCWMPLPEPPKEVQP